MKTSFNELETCLDEKSPRTRPLFRVLILFEDEGVSDRAKRLHGHLFQNVKDHCRLETYRWGTKQRGGVEELVETITMADLIIVAGRETSELPEEIQTALRIGLAERRLESGALVALLGRTNIREQNPSALHLFLQKVARKSGLNFFPGAFELPQDDHAYDIDSIHDRAERMTPTMHRILHRNITPIGYGINK